MILGAHESIAGGVYNAFDDAEEDGCKALQIFSKNANQWFAKKPISEDVIEKFNAARERTGIWEIMVHDSYLINLANPDDGKWNFSINAFHDEMERVESLKIPYLVFHPGAHLKKGEEFGIERISDALNTLHGKTKGFDQLTIIESTAGQGTYMGYKLEHIGKILDRLDDRSRAGVCVDTCHSFTAGYELHTAEGWDKFIEEFDSLIGLDMLRAFHLNDSKYPLGSKKDRHEHIGEGYIGPEGFRFLVNEPRFREIPGILETPPMEGKRGYIENLETLHSLIE